jgi:hypothetical protein
MVSLTSVIFAGIPIILSTTPPIEEVNPFVIPLVNPPVAPPVEPPAPPLIPPIPPVIPPVPPPTTFVIPPRFEAAPILSLTLNSIYFTHNFTKIKIKNPTFQLVCLLLHLLYPLMNQVHPMSKLFYQLIF